MKLLSLFLLFLTVLFYYDRFEYVNLEKYSTSFKQVEIKGEVKKPGVYELDLHDTVQDLIKVAGGVTSQADLSSINQNQDVLNKGVIVIPQKKEKEKISINSASLEELDTLPGIGPSTAKRIIEFRKVHPFIKVEDIMKIKGIKQKLFNKIKDSICL